MRYTVPQVVELTGDEDKLFASLSHDPTHEEWPRVADAMEALFRSLVTRDAIPRIRLALFADPNLAVTGSRSPQQVFESNGTTGDDIFRHPNFLKYLRYFVNGPDLPEPVAQGLCDILNEDKGTSGMVLDQYRKHARSSVRKYGLDRNHAADEFYRLALEIGMEKHAAKSLRDAAKSVR